MPCPLPVLQVLPLVAAPTSHQLPVHRGPAAEGVALKIRRTPRRGAAGRDGIATEFSSKLGFRGSPPLPPAPGSKRTGDSENRRNSRAQKKRSRAPKLSLLGARRASKIVKNVKKVIPELPRIPSENSVEISRFFGALKPRKRCWRQHGSFILTFATNLGIAPKKLPNNLLLGTLSAPKCLNFGICGHLKMNEKSSDKKCGKTRKTTPKRVRRFVPKLFFWTPVPRHRPKRVQGCPGPPKALFFSKI